MVVISWFIHQHSHHWGAPSCMPSGPQGLLIWPERLISVDYFIKYIFGVSNYVFISMWISGTDWLEVPTIYVGEYHPHKIWPEKWYSTSILGSWRSPIDSYVDCRCINRWGGWLLQKTFFCVLHVEEVPKPHDWGPLRGCFSQVRRP